MRRLAAIATAVLAAHAAVALAAAAPVRTVGLVRKHGKVLASVGLADLLQLADVERLRSGFASRIVVRVGLERVGAAGLVAQTYRRSDVIYDLWEERFRIRRISPGVAQEVLLADSERGAIALAAELVAFPVADISRLHPGATYRLAFRADLNPVAEEAVADVRRWLSRPAGQGRLATGDGFFGSMVSLFFNPRIEDSERRVEFVSQTFVEPQP